MQGEGERRKKAGRRHRENAQAVQRVRVGAQARTTRYLVSASMCNERRTGAGTRIARAAGVVRAGRTGRQAAGGTVRGGFWVPHFVELQCEKHFWMLIADGSLLYTLYGGF